MKDLISKYLVTITLIIIGFIGFFAVVMLTSKRGIGLSGHGPEYIRMAVGLIDRSLIKPDTVLNYWQHFPPLYPLSLVVIKWLGGPDPLLAARWLNAVLFGMNIFLVGLLIYRQTDSVWLAVTGSSWMLVKIDIVQIHSMAMAESLYLFWVLLWLVFFTDYLDTRRTESLLMCSVAAGLACVTRFAGIPLILTGIVMLLCDKKRTVAKSLAVAAVFGCVSLIPMILWMAKNSLDGDSVVNRTFNFHPAYIPFGQYVWPINPYHLHVFPVVVVLFFLGWLIWQKRDPVVFEKALMHKERFLNSVILFIMFYLLSWLMTISFLDAEAYCVRYFIPVEIFELFLCFLSVGILLSSAKNSRFLKVLFCAFLSIYFIGMNSLSAAQWFGKRYHDGEEYDGKEWEKSEIIQEVKKITSGAIIYSNNVEAIYTRANLQAIPLTLVSKVDMISLRDNPFYGHMLNKMKEDLKGKKAVIVFFYFKPQNDKLPTLDEINKEIPLKILVNASDGGIYAWDDEEY